MENAKKCIVLAWVVSENVWDGKAFAADLGARPTFKTTRTAKAAMWLNRGTDADVEKAKAYVKSDIENGFVFTFPVDEKDPLGAAKKLALKRAA